jgi:hypothetical protein
MFKGKLRLFLLIAAALAGIGQSCAPTDSTESKNKSNPQSVDDFDIARSLTSGPGSGKIYIICFSGPNDHDNVAGSMCRKMESECIARYGRQRCVVPRDPSREVISRLGDDGLVIFVGHSTPCSISPDGQPNPNCAVDIWDTPVSPKDINDNKGDKPVIWYGCYGNSVSKECPNVIPLQDVPTVLDTRDPAIACRFTATMLCWEGLSRRNRRNPTTDDIMACVARKVPELTTRGDPMCSAAAQSPQGAPVPPAIPAAPSPGAAAGVTSPTR